MRLPRHPQAREEWRAERQPDAARAARLVFLDEDRNHDENDAPARDVARRAGASGQSPFRPLEDPDLRRRIALRSAFTAPFDSSMRRWTAESSRPMSRLQLVPALDKGDIVIMRQSARPQRPSRRGHPRPAAHRFSFLPPYSPDLSPIEMAFSKLKPQSARQVCPNHRRTLESHRSNLRPVPTRRVHKLLHRRRIRIHVSLRRSRRSHADRVWLAPTGVRAS